MTPGRRGATVTAALVTVLALLAGCGGSSEPAAAPSATTSPSPRVDPRPPEATDDASPAATPTQDPLAEAVEEQLRQQAQDAEDTAEGVNDLLPVLGADISWPQCPKGLGIPQKRTLGAPMPLPEARYVVIGLTNGPGFYPNPCLAEQTAWVRSRGLMAAAYAVASYPRPDELRTYRDRGPFDAGDPAGALANVGYAQARFNLASMRDAGLLTPIVWIDVEPVPDFAWSSDREANAAVVLGLARGYTDAGYRIGVYSTPLLWDGVVGDFTLDGVPEWRAAGQTSSAEALSRCGDDWSIQGGPGVLGQWVEAERDQNLTCPGVAADLGSWFHQY